jgi:hypothetical protein
MKLLPTSPNAPSNHPGYPEAGQTRPEAVWRQPEGSSATFYELLFADCRLTIWFSQRDAGGAPSWMGALQRVDTCDVFWLEALRATRLDLAQAECLDRARSFLRHVALKLEEL